MRRKSPTTRSSPLAVGATPALSRIADASAEPPPRAPARACRSIFRRCPNAALPSSRYCGLERHQALEGKAPDVVGRA